MNGAAHAVTRTVAKNYVQPILENPEKVVSGEQDCDGSQSLTSKTSFFVHDDVIID
jgi:hypothetical protein